MDVENLGEKEGSYINDSFQPRQRLDVAEMRHNHVNPLPDIQDDNPRTIYYFGQQIVFHYSRKPIDFHAIQLPVVQLNAIR
jgi:hypothetical protein